MSFENGESMLIRYVRVSIDDQYLKLHKYALDGAGCTGVFNDEALGARRDRPCLNAALSHLKKRDTLVV